jgi:hypothetical protein
MTSSDSTVMLIDGDWKERGTGEGDVRSMSVGVLALEA